MVTSKQVKDHLGIDYEDEMVDRNIERLITWADAKIQAAVGKNYPKDDPKAIELALTIIEVRYNHGDMSDRVSQNIEKMINEDCLQLRLEMLEG